MIVGRVDLKVLWLMQGRMANELAAADGMSLDVLHLGGTKKMDEAAKVVLVQWRVLMVVRELKRIGSGHNTVVCEDCAALAKWLESEEDIWEDSVAAPFSVGLMVEV
jgi:hypothetical protein